MIQSLNASREGCMIGSDALAAKVLPTAIAAGEASGVKTVDFLNNDD
jgi:hypothetical protein